ncbi:contact-dependent growth inhibition system immunity protein [Synechocystis sp. PCC 7509]|uniref:contact-dependent growth inhibition system immunity protein n=1 Tax=Synechocystis sp. PCC 7509 TaxID=927677 RepID=UPI0002AD05B3|nr:hypothetical protein [Synechocystis sp. PCC 7509]
MNIKDQYPNLTNFFEAYIHEADLDGFASDEEVAQQYAVTESSFARSRVIEQGRALLLESSFPWEQIGDKTNRDFQDEQNTRQWLQKLIEIIVSGAAI